MCVGVNVCERDKRGGECLEKEVKGMVYKKERK